MTRTGFDLFNDLFFNDNFLRPYYSTTRGTSSPATNVIEEEDAYKLQVSAPGFTKAVWKIRSTSLRKGSRE